jgi:hypothetical protein
MLKETTAAIVRSWKFELPKNLFRTEWKYDTIFRYHLSGKDVRSRILRRRLSFFLSADTPIL